LVLPFKSSSLNDLLQPIKFFQDLSLPHNSLLIHSFCSRLSGIYAFFNHQTNLIYVGSAADLSVRFSGHLFYHKTNLRLKRSFLKYGLSSFSFIVFDFFPHYSRDFTSFGLINPSLLDLETFYIQSFPPEVLFNFKYHATSMIGYKHSPEAKAKIKLILNSDAHPRLGVKHSPEAKAKISLSTSGLNNPLFGKQHSIHTKIRLSLAKSHFLFLVLDLHNNVVSSFSQVSLLAQSLGIHRSVVYRYLKSGKIFNNQFRFLRSSPDSKV
jgi:group I intron endonuclease